MDTILLIDGENIKGKIKDVFKELGREKPNWHEYNFKALFDKVLDGIEINRKVFYFAKIKEHDKSIEKSKQLIEEQRLLKTHLEKQGFEVILRGRVRGQIENINGKDILVFREKGVDVKIAVDMVSLACDKKIKEIILCSSDSDLQPAIEEVKIRKVNCIYLGFEVNPNKGLFYTTKRTILIRNSEVLEFEKVQNKLNKITSVQRCPLYTYTDYAVLLSETKESNVLGGLVKLLLKSSINQSRISSGSIFILYKLSILFQLGIFESIWFDSSISCSRFRSPDK